jgi:hypothetical protein
VISEVGAEVHAHTAPDAQVIFQDIGYQFIRSKNSHFADLLLRQLQVLRMLYDLEDDKYQYHPSPGVNTSEIAVQYPLFEFFYVNFNPEMYL